MLSIFSTLILFFFGNPDLLVLDETDYDKSFELSSISSMPFNLRADDFEILLATLANLRTPFNFRLMKDSESFGEAETAEKGRTIATPLMTLDAVVTVYCFGLFLIFFSPYNSLNFCIYFLSEGHPLNCILSSFSMSIFLSSLMLLPVANFYKLENRYDLLDLHLFLDSY